MTDAGDARGDAEAWCEVMDMPKLGCAHCRPAAERKRLAALDAELRLTGGNTAPRRDVLHATGKEPWMIARYEGWCAARCGAPIEPGQEIVQAPDTRMWYHLGCTDYYT